MGKPLAGRGCPRVACSMAQARLDAIAAAPQGRALLGDVLDVLLDVWLPLYNS